MIDVEAGEIATEQNAADRRKRQTIRYPLVCHGDVDFFVARRKRSNI